METGFHHSGKRIALELLAIVGFVALLGWGVYAGLGAIASRALPFVPPSVDVAIGQAAFKMFDHRFARCDAPETVAFVDEVSRPLIEALGPMPYPFEVAVVESDQVNAFALPGGKIVVFTGLIEAADTGEEVAGVLAHEISHVTRRHSMQNVLGQAGTMTVLGLVFGLVDVSGLAAPLVALSENAYSRELESDADRVGHELLVKAGIDPYGLAAFFQRLEKESSVKVPELLSTHPDPGQRMQAIVERPVEAAPTRHLSRPAKRVRCQASEPLEDADVEEDTPSAAPHPSGE